MVEGSEMSSKKAPHIDAVLSRFLQMASECTTSQKNEPAIVS